MLWPCNTRMISVLWVCLAIASAAFCIALGALTDAGVVGAGDGVTGAAATAGVPTAGVPTAGVPGAGSLVRFLGAIFAAGSADVWLVFGFFLLLLSVPSTVAGVSRPGIVIPSSTSTMPPSPCDMRKLKFPNLYSNIHVQRKKQDNKTTTWEF